MLFPKVSTPSKSCGQEIWLLACCDLVLLFGFQLEECTQKKHDFAREEVSSFIDTIDSF